MAIVVKKVAGKPRRPSRAAGRKRGAKRAPARAVLASRAEDAVERKKIGKTLDVAAFTAHHKRNSASAAHWETAE